MILETRKRHIVKAVIYRIVSIFTTFLIAWAITASALVSTAFALSMAITAIEHSFKIFLLYFYDRIWTKINYGKVLESKMGCCIWLCGLSGAGKTTLALKLKEKIESRLIKVEYLDGDIVRQTICRGLGFTKEDREENLRRVSYVAGHLSRSSVVVAAFIAPYREHRERLRGLSENFVEVYVNAPLSVCEARDVKGLYAKAREGEIKNFTGIDDPFEPPISPEIEVRTDIHSVDECVDQIIKYLEERKLI